MDTTAARHRSVHSATVAQALASLDKELRSHTARDVRVVPTRFGVLDEVLGGGIRGGELLMLGGPPGVGKTIMALQWARNMARAGHTAVYACYEHEPTTLLIRLLAMEAGEAGGDESIARAIERELIDADVTGMGVTDVVGRAPAGAAALERIAEYAERLVFVRASGSRTTVDDLQQMLEPIVGPSESAVVFVDYLQKIPLHPEPDTEAEKVTRTVEAVKDLALDLQVPVVMLSAVDGEGLRASRMRLYHLRGSSAIAFESDAVVMLNDKHRAVSKVHLSYDPKGTQTFRNWVVASVEKNRGGPNLIDLEFRKDFAHYRFDPEGGVVKERLVDERTDESAF